MLFYFFIFIECTSVQPDSSRCKFVDSIKSLPNDKLQLTPSTISKDHFCNIHKTFDVTFKSDSRSKVQIVKIPDHLFYDCFIGTLSLSEKITTIGLASFSHCKINEIKFHPKSKLTEIGDYAFCQAQITKELQFPCSILSIGNFSFSNCKLSESLTIPNSVTSIGIYAFSQCQTLASITLSNSVKSIGNYTFSFCVSLSSITIPEKVSSIVYSAFNKCIKLKTITVSSKNSHFKSIEGVLFNKDGTKLVLYPPGIKETSYSVPENVKSIGDYAFWQCELLSTITLPNNLTSIGDYAFSMCQSLSSITLPNNVASIGNNAFSQCQTLSSITLSNSVTSIGNSTFSYCGSLSSIEIPDNVASIGHNVFIGCNKLEAITVGSMNLHFKSIEGVLFNKDGS